ncbi:hypothetical protein [Nocardioides speluncae]|uniref:hypothetical protein n=1 Tax=Nocardioides speluncae TaxID=2670337 RepID=UPI000D69945C|nr:hypothetical protein [Nocardioides speluncae]
MRTTALTAAATTFCLAAGIAPAAYAEKLVHDDARRDVQRGTVSPSGGAITVVDRRFTDPDIVRIAIDYRRERLEIRIKHTAMRRAVGRGSQVRVKADDGVAYLGWAYVRTRGKWQGRTEFGIDEGTEIGDPCSGVRHRFQYDRQVSLWSIPAACIGKVSRIRVGAYSSVFRRSDRRILIDDSHHAGLSRWIRRG